MTREVLHSVKLFAAISACILVTTALAACSSNSTDAACGTAPSGGNTVNQVKVSGEFGKKPTVEFAKGLTASGTQVEVVSTGTGPLVSAGESVAIDAQLYNGKTGDLIQSTSFDSKNFATIPVSKEKLGGLGEAMTCQHVGSRIVATIGNDQALATSLGLDRTDTVVAVVDIERKNLARANGEPQQAPDGLPRVVLDAKGVPGITVPQSAPPSDFRVVVLKKGSGAVVGQNANATVHYVGVTWSKTPYSLGSSWKDGAPIEFSGETSIGGFWKGIAGQTVGSQVLLVVPPSLGYGSVAKGDLPANSTLIFVVDILGASE